MAGCDETFTPKTEKQLCCCERHGKIHYNRVSRADGRQKLPQWNEKRQAHWKKRKAIKKGAPEHPAEVFTRHEIGRRDGWICGICAKPIHRWVLHPDPKSASIDHILPLSKGGTHTRANVRIAHLDCNVARGNRVEGEGLPMAS
jgi:5-methylcytosine-specific restriction endonuclease McrA